MMLTQLSPAAVLRPINCRGANRLSQRRSGRHATNPTRLSLLFSRQSAHAWARQVRPPTRPFALDSTRRRPEVNRRLPSALRLFRLRNSSCADGLFCYLSRLGVNAPTPITRRRTFASSEYTGSLFVVSVITVRPPPERILQPIQRSHQRPDLTRSIALAPVVAVSPISAV
jgi:hypothetical protein